MTTDSYEQVVYCPVCGAMSRDAGTSLGGFALYACRECGFRFAPSAFRVSVDYASLYESPEYIDAQVKPLASVTNRATFANIATYRPFFARVSCDGGTTLLDVGCGVGRFCHAAHSRGWDVTGIDISPTAIAIGSKHSLFRLHAASVDDLVTRQARFDVVTAFEVLEHLPNPREFLTKVVRLVRPGGQIFCTVPNWDARSVQRAQCRDWLPPVHLGFFTMTALRRLGELSGMKAVSTGLISTDVAPRHPVRLARWAIRRLIRGSWDPEGIWLHGRTAI